MTIDKPHTVSEQRASQGRKLGEMRYVLGFSLAFAVAAGVVIYSMYQ